MNDMRLSKTRNINKEMINGQFSAVYGEKLPKGAWLTVVLLFFIGALNYLDRIMITTMRSSIIDSMPMSEAQFGLLTSAFLWTYGILSPFAGYVADRFNRSKVVMMSLFVWSLITWITAYSKTFEQLLATRILMGISEACYIPAALALIADYHRSSTRSLATGIHMTGIMIGSSLGFIGGMVAENIAWNSPFILFGIIGTLYAIVIAFILHDPPKEDGVQPHGKHTTKFSFLEGVFDLFRKREYLLMLGYWGLLGVVGWMVIGWLPTYYKEHFNLSQGIAGLYATGYLYPAQIVGLLLGGFLADRWSRTNRLSRIQVPAIGLCIAAPCVFLASTTYVLPAAIVALVFYAITRSFSDSNMMPMLCMVADPRYRATGYGILNFFSTIIGGVALYAGGVLRDADIDLSKMYQFAAFTIIICAIMLFLIRPKTQ